MATIMPDSRLARLRLLQLISPSLPVGAFTYSQGLEWAVEAGWVNDEHSLSEWTESLMWSGMARLEIPLLARLFLASEAEDESAQAHWTRYLLASRETSELRLEERNRGRALAALLPELGIPCSPLQLELFKGCQLAGFAHAAHYWQVPLADAAAGYLWGWLENSVLAGVKIIPLGQTAGQRIIGGLTPRIPEIVSHGLELQEWEIGASCPAQAIASSLHETQYTRIYRS